MVNIKRKYGRTIPDPLPPHRMLDRVNTNIPPVVDLRTNCGPIKDQGQEGSCTGHAFSSANELINRRYLKRQPVLSPQFLYVQELIHDGNFPNDAGSEGTTGCIVSVSFGCCETSLFPYVSGQITKPSAIQLQNALLYTLGAYHGLTGSKVALSVLGDPTPWPVAIGFSVYDSFQSDATANTGVMTVPAKSEALLGGHEVLCVGYDIGATPSLRPTNCPPAMLIQNSWGTDWGIKGFFWMPLEILDDLDTDLKIVHSGHPWK